MRVRAKCWINHNGTWHKGGEEFEIEDTEILDGVEIVKAEIAVESAPVEVGAEPTQDGEFKSEIFPPLDEEAPKKRGRPRKS